MGMTDEDYVPLDRRRFYPNGPPVMWIRYYYRAVIVPDLETRMAVPSDERYSSPLI